MEKALTHEQRERKLQIQLDPAIHECLQVLPSAFADGTIVAEEEKGYYREGTMLRPARVHVSRSNDSGRIS